LVVQKFDTYVLQLFEGSRAPWLNGIAVDYTALGSTTVLTLATILFSIFMLLRQRRDLVMQIVVAAGGAGLVSRALKGFFERERPTLVDHLVVVKGYSYPSGHSLASAAVYLTIVWVVAKDLTRKDQRVVLLSLGGLIVALIGLSRIYLGVHYPSDVLTGWFVGTLWAVLVDKISPAFARVAKARRS